MAFATPSNSNSGNSISSLPILEAPSELGLEFSAMREVQKMHSDYTKHEIIIFKGKCYSLLIFSFRLLFKILPLFV